MYVSKDVRSRAKLVKVGFRLVSFGIDEIESSGKCSVDCAIRQMSANVVRTSSPTSTDRLGGSRAGAGVDLPFVPYWKVGELPESGAARQFDS